MAANVPAWKAFLKRMGYSQTGANHLTDKEMIKTMPVLRRLDPTKIGLINKRMVNPGGTTASISVTASAEMNLAITVYVSRYWARASCPYGPGDIELNPPDLFEEAEAQESLERDWDNSCATFTPS